MGIFDEDEGDQDWGAEEDVEEGEGGEDDELMAGRWICFELLLLWWLS